MISYRQDIDGLRALAVMLVVLFHFKIAGFSGGFIGVDIFFVISGFLITSVIQKDLENGCFSFATFYEKRLRRILPAYVTVTIATLIAGFYYLLPSDYVSLAQSALSATFYVSNFYFWSIAGYFQVSPEEQPLLHTWSLSVEEQFYIFLPVVMWFSFTRKFKKPLITYGLGACLFLSLFAAEYIVRTAPEFSFFMLPTRIWEFGMGAILVHKKLPRLTGSMPNTLIGLLGLGLILGANFIYTDATLFPGLSALPPCLGAALLIYSGMSSNKIKTLLSYKYVNLTGKMSYSIYLWHWPIIAFAHKRLGDISSEEKILLIVLTLIISFFSWKYIETPWRNRAFMTQKQIYKISGLIACLFLVFISALQNGKGWPSRFGENILIYETALEDHNPMRELCSDAPLVKHREEIEKCYIGDIKQEHLKAIVWGDSIADSLTPGISDVLKTYNLKGLQATRNSCTPLINVYQDRFPQAFAEECKAYNDEVLEFIIQNPQIEYVFLTGSWLDLFENFSYPEFKSNYDSLELKSKAFEQATLETIETLRRANKKVIMLSVIPIYPYSAVECYARQTLFNDAHRFKCEKFAFTEFEKQNHHILQTHKKVQEKYNDVMMYFPHDVLCDEASCMAVNESTVFYYDRGHLSTSGARYIAQDMIIDMRDFFTK